MKVTWWAGLHSGAGAAGHDKVAVPEIEDWDAENLPAAEAAKLVECGREMGSPMTRGSILLGLLPGLLLTPAAAIEAQQCDLEVEFRASNSCVDTQAMRCQHPIKVYKLTNAGG